MDGGGAGGNGAGGVGAGGVGAGGDADSGDEAVDPNLFEPTEPAFASINSVTAAQKAFFEETVGGMAHNPYGKWRSLWVEPGDPTLLDAPFGTDDNPTDAAWQRLRIFFWSPSELAPWQKLGVRMPCARHGWAHARYVSVLGRWSQRLVKGVYGDFALAGKECRCSECRREYGRLDAQYQAAKSARVPEARLAPLRDKVKAASFGFQTYDPRVTAFFYERHPWLAVKLPAFVTHRAAVSTEVLFLLTRGVRRGDGPGSTEQQLREFRALLASTNAVEFYGCQRDWRQRPQLAATPPTSPVHLQSAISSVTDHYLNAILEDWYFSSVEKYLLQWFEQHCPLDKAVQADHHCKCAALPPLLCPAPLVQSRSISLNLAQSRSISRTGTRRGCRRTASGCCPTCTRR